jgi:hypothetical protein
MDHFAGLLGRPKMACQARAASVYRFGARHDRQETPSAPSMACPTDLAPLGLPTPHGLARACIELGAWLVFDDVGR